MNRWTLFILGGTLLSPGCLSLPDWFGAHKAAMIQEQPALPPLPAPPPPRVTADMITQENAAQVAKAMQAELDYDAANQP
jgi:hypothetical protein